MLLSKVAESAIYSAMMQMCTRWKTYSPNLSKNVEACNIRIQLADITGSVARQLNRNCIHVQTSDLEVVYIGCT